MKTGIIVAMDKELALMLPLLQNHAVVSIDGHMYHCGRLAGHDTVISKVGIGKVNAALGALSLIDNFHPSLIINTGVAGGTGAGECPARVLDLMLASEVAYHDVWCGPGTVPGQADGCPPRFVCPLPADVADKLGARTGLLASGDIFVDNPEVLGRILEIYPDAFAVDMESAAIAQVCNLKDVPFVCLRVISDTPGDGGNATAYDSFWQSAPERTFGAVEKLLSLI